MQSLKSASALLLEGIAVCYVTRLGTRIRSVALYRQSGSYFSSSHSLIDHKVMSYGKGSMCRWACARDADKRAALLWFVNYNDIKSAFACVARVQRFEAI